MNVNGRKQTPRWQRILQSIRIGSKKDCWEWQGIIQVNGYGRFNERVAKGVAYKNKTAHRVVYEAFWGEIPEKYTIDHLCRNRRCVNPLHLEAVPHRINLDRAPNQVSTINRHKTHCKRGHEFTSDNIYRRPDRPIDRSCRACSRFRSRKYAFIQRERVAILVS